MLLVVPAVQQIKRSRYITRAWTKHPDFKQHMAVLKSKYGGSAHTLHLPCGIDDCSPTVFQEVFGFLLESPDTLDPKTDLDGEADYGKGKKIENVQTLPAKKQDCGSSKKQPESSQDECGSNGSNSDSEQNGSSVNGSTRDGQSRC